MRSHDIHLTPPLKSAKLACVALRNPLHLFYRYGNRKMKGRGFTLIELLVVIAIIALLVSILCPSLIGATRLARLVVCQCNISSIHKGLVLYTVANNQNFPPFAFSSAAAPDLSLSGHWGGVTRPEDPNGFGRIGVENVNLWALVAPAFLAEALLICPAAEADLRSNTSNYFPYSERFSTYCLRFPPSEDIFADSPGLANTTGMLLGVYRWAGGGQRVRVGQEYQQVPLVRMDRTYRVDGEVFDPAAGVLLADTFWLLDESAQPVAETDGNVVKPSACHGEDYNILRGDGSVKTASDDGTVAENTISPGESNPFSVRSENIWRFFDKAK